MKDSIGFMRSERIESGEKYERISKYKDIDNNDKDRLLSILPNEHITLSNQMVPNLDDLFENVDEYPVEKNIIKIPKFSYCEEGVKHKQQSRSSHNREIKEINSEFDPKIDVSKVQMLKSNNRIEQIKKELVEFQIEGEKKQIKKGKKTLKELRNGNFDQKCGFHRSNVSGRAFSKINKSDMSEDKSKPGSMFSRFRRKSEINIQSEHSKIK